MNAQQLLEQLSTAEDQAQLIALRFQEMRDSILTPEIKAQLAELDAEQEQAIAAIKAGIDSLREQVKVAVLAEGKSVKGGTFQAVYSAGRVSWDTKALDGYAAAHPEIGKFRKIGEPTISIRAAK